ncbi:hypothetical protein [Variovorax sp. 278MFTsu5.1]|jgi:hypothetical protein|uniref:hypothetical protein n=1 Tax=Variovorax sp. 278MFTsu5.1 TaxID=3158366 RepID=UPI003AAB3E9D
MTAAQQTPGRLWWRAPADQRFRAYYRCMREVYGMTASEALAYARKVFAQYPAFMNDPVGTLRNSLATAQGAAS